MSLESPKYAVAISFLSRDEAIASAIHDRLSTGLEVFFFPRKQEALAGTDGLASMRTPFLDDSRLMVVLYREDWGKTPWTRVEETAIKEACLLHGWQRLFFIVLDRTSILPVWLPQNHVRFNYDDFGLEQAVGAIKARVQDNGGQVTPLTARKRAELFQAEQEFFSHKSRMNSEEGRVRIFNSILELFHEIEQRCEQINEQKGFLQIRHESAVEERSAYQTCSITNGRVGLVVSWSQPYTNSLQSSALFVREFDGGLILPSERGQKMYVAQPETVRETRYCPELSLAREYGWRRSEGTEFLSSPDFAEHCVIEFVELVSRYAGQLPGY